MDLLNKVVQGDGCNVDGTVASQNPLSRAMDNVMRSQHQRPASHPHQAQHELAAQMQQAHISQQQGYNDAAMRQFEQQARYQHMNATMSAPNRQAMEAAFHDAHFQQQAPPPPMQMHHSWVSEFQGNGRAHMDQAWNHSGMQPPEAAWQDSKLPAHAMPAYSGMHYQQKYQATAAAPAAQEPVERDLTKEASQHMAETMEQNQDPKWQNSEFLQFMKDVSGGQVEFDEAGNEVKGTPTSELKHNVDAAGQNVMEEAFEESKAAPQTINGRSLDSIWQEAQGRDAVKMNAAWQDEGNLEAIWEKAMADAKTTDPFDEIWETTGMHTNREYVPQKENAFLDGSDNFAKGLEFFKQGKLDEAVLALEAEVQQNPTHSEAWRVLGECHAEQDADKNAIICFERAVEEDPYNLSALLSLGVSHVNELNPQDALSTLKAWVRHNPKFHSLEIRLDEYSDGSLMDEVMQLMLQAQAHDPTDSDVAVVLGVLYNVSKDFDAAASSLRKAAEERPEEYSLWNKLGATLANSGHSGEAIPAYHRALELKPRYARGWLNLGISHANLGKYEEAVQCYLQALTLNPQADHVWSYLRICFTCMQRFDLVKLSDTKDLKAFEPEFPLLEL